MGEWSSHNVDSIVVTIAITLTITCSWIGQHSSSTWHGAVSKLLETFVHSSAIIGLATGITSVMCSEIGNVTPSRVKVPVCCYQSLSAMICVPYLMVIVRYSCTTRQGVKSSAWTVLCNCEVHAWYNLSIILFLWTGKARCNSRLCSVTPLHTISKYYWGR